MCWGVLIPIYTVPTAASESPLVGPALPVVAIAKSVFKIALALLAMATATSSLTTECSFTIFSSTPNTFTLASVA